MEEEFAREAKSATHYVVEMGHGASSRFVLCERVLTVDGSDAAASLSREALEALFRQNPLRAIALPTVDGSRQHRSSAVWPQMFGVNVTINNKE